MATRINSAAADFPEGNDSAGSTLTTLKKKTNKKLSAYLNAARHTEGGLLVTLMGSLALMTELKGNRTSTHAGANRIDSLFPNNNFPHGLLWH